MCLDAIPDNEIEQAIVDYAIQMVHTGDENGRTNFLAMPLGIQALYSTWLVDGEVNNGGFNQYFWNSSGAFADLAVVGFDYFGAHEHAQLLCEAIAVADAERAVREKFKRRNTMQAFSESYDETRLGALDTKYYALPDTLSELRIRAVRKCPTDFVTGPSARQ